MKRGFTLLELLITIAVMATLMTIMFKLGNSSNDETARINTVSKMQRLENCLSGYYAAFGSYPPVKVHGSRDIYIKVENGAQQLGERNESLVWSQIEAACRCQPMEASFPFDLGSSDFVQSEANYYKKHAEDFKDTQYYAAFSSGFNLPSAGEFTEYWDDAEWAQVQLFKFGVMSFLLPRYLVMMKGEAEFYGGTGGRPCKQWSANNDNLVSATDGKVMTWKDVFRAVERTDDDEDTSGNGGIKDIQEYIKVANMPSQAVCARWLGNLSGLCATASESGKDKVFGVSIKDEAAGLFDFDTSEENSDGSWHMEIYSPGGDGGSWYVLNAITVLDGWGNTFFYYSPPGFQSYVLWSAGANRRTFPPWIDKTDFLDKYPDDPKRGSTMTVADWLEDDITGMKD